MHTVKRAYEPYANTRDEATLEVKLDAHGEVAYERFANARSKATLVRV